MINLILAFISGLLLILAFPKFDLYLLAYVAIVPLLICVKRSRSLLEAVLCGTLSGVVFFGGVLFWINTLHKWAGPWAYLAWAALVVFQALYIAAFAGAAKYISVKYPKACIFLIPFVWAAIEWIRSIGPYGVTGGGLGYSQADFLMVLQVASVAGVYGISFLIVFFNEAVAGALLDKKIGNLGIAILILTLAVVFGNYKISAFKESGKAINIAVVQANISQDTKLDYRRAYEIVNIYEMMSRKAASSRPDIVIWPETAVTTYLFETSTMLSKVQDLVAGSNSFYLIGTPYREKGRIYNSVAAFSKKGRMIGRYDKQRLVPFGEYLPLRPLFYRLLQEDPLFAQDYNSNPDPNIINLDGVRVGAVICFESTLPYLVRDKVKQGAQFILVVTNDAWFFDSSALYQHIQAAQVRAVESGRYVVQAANTGISAIIDPVGRVVARSNIEEACVLTGKIYVY
ncbi:MAG: apolipoprotein N-acyltransferase [bacterium]